MTDKINAVDREYSLYPLSSEPADFSVKVEYDPSIAEEWKKNNKNKKKSKSAENSVDDSRDDLRGFGQRLSTSENMAQASSLKKERRMMELHQGMQDGSITTLKEASIKIGVREQTIKKYLKEMGKTLKED